MKKGKEGFVLVTTLLIISIIIIITLAYVARVVTEYNLMSKMCHSSLVLDIAEGGIDQAVWQIAYNGCSFPGWTYGKDASNNQTWTLTNTAFTDTKGNIIGYYDAIVTLPASQSVYTINATAYTPTKARYDERKQIVVNYTSQFHFSNGIAAVGSGSSIKFSGQAYIDSYDSTLGPYAGQPHTNQGNIVANGNIILSSQADIYGNANPGPGGTVSTSGQANITGSTSPLSAPVNVAAISASTINTAKTTNNNSNITLTHSGNTGPYTGGYALSVSGQDTLTLPGGTYYFTSMSLSGQAKINVTGQTTIYVDGGNVSISGQGIVNNGAPSQLGIYSTGDNVSLSGQAAYSGTIYAPTAAVSLSGQQAVYGAIVAGSEIDSGQAAVHFDLALLNALTYVQPPSNYRSITWQEQ